jgi:PiT family inorganic phosphate transporter
MGAGAAKRLSAVRWGVAGNILLAWVITLPIAALFGAAAYAVASVFGNGATGPLLMALVSLALVAAALVNRRRRMTELVSA